MRTVNAKLRVMGDCDVMNIKTISGNIEKLLLVFFSKLMPYTLELPIFAFYKVFYTKQKLSD